MKFDEITVTFHPINETVPNIIMGNLMQFDMQTNIQTGFLNTIYKTINMNIRAPIPKIIISFLTKVIVSSAIETPQGVFLNLRIEFIQLLLLFHLYFYGVFCHNFLLFS